MEGLAKPNYKDIMVTRDGYNNDIIVTLNKQFPEAVKQVENVKIGGADHYQKGRAIYNYLKYSVNYKKDPAGKQVIQLPARMINDTKSGDCKSKALAAAALMDVNGFKDVALRYASYDPNDKTPTHVYAVGKDDKGKEIIIDPVWKSYNTQAPYKHKKDYKMEISVISGVVEETRTTSSSAVPKMKKGASYASRLNALLNKVKAGGVLHNIIVNEMARTQGKTLMSNYSSDQLQRYKKFLQKVSMRAKAPALKDLISKEIQTINNGAFSGHIYLPTGRQAIKGLEEEIGKISLRKIAKKLDPRKALQAAKAVTFLPIRKAFLLLVSLNVRGLAKRLSKLSASGKKFFWVNQFGGKLSTLEGAIKRGLKKKPLFGASKKIKAIKGIGYVVDNSNYIGAFDISKLGASAGGAGAGAAALAAGGSNPAGAATLGSILAAAAPILAIIAKLFNKEKVEDVPEAAGQPESSDFKDVTPEGETTLNKLETFVGKAADVATKLGVIPEAKEDANTATVTKLTGSETSEEDVVDGKTGDRSLAPALQNIPMPVLIGGAALVGYLLIKKKK